MLKAERKRSLKQKAPSGTVEGKRVCGADMQFGYEGLDVWKSDYSELEFNGKKIASMIMSHIKSLKRL